MSEKLYSYVEDYNSWFICEGEKRLYAEEVVDLLNEQQDTIKKQDERIKELESILADDIVRKSEIKEVWKQRTEKKG